MKINILKITTNRCNVKDKIQYNTIEEANDIIPIIIKKTSITTYTAYKCKYCKKYHIGHIHNYG